MKKSWPGSTFNTFFFNQIILIILYRTFFLDDLFDEIRCLFEVDIDRVVLQIDGLDSLELDARALVVGIPGVDVVPVGHGALGRV